MILNELENRIAKKIQLPDTCYKDAQKRYSALADFLGRDNSIIKDYIPQIQPQGSLRLGTAIYPHTGDNEFDLDLTLIMKLLTTRDITQAELKRQVMYELREYAKTNNMLPPEDNRRCGTLQYREHNGFLFHEDVVPAIPRVERYREDWRFVEDSYPNINSMAKESAIHGIFITDRDRKNFNTISDDWHSSNPERFALWFEECANNHDENSSVRHMCDSIDTVPLEFWARKSELQLIVQLLKWHRNNMFKKNPECKPTSIIITVLAARAYLEGASSVAEILEKMGRIVIRENGHVYNPVDHSEDFTDKWRESKHLKDDLSGNFWKWLNQAYQDFFKLENASNTKRDIEAILREQFNISNMDLSGVVFANEPILIKETKDVSKRWGR